METSEQNLKLLPFFVVVCFSRLDCVPSLALIKRQLGNELFKGRRGQVKRQLASLEFVCCLVCFSRLDCVPSLALIMRQLGCSTFARIKLASQDRFEECMSLAQS